MDELMLKVLEDPNRVINGDQYNNLYKYFTQTMTDEAARSFLAANYMMTHDFYSQYVNNGYLEDDLSLASGLNDGIRKVEVQQRIGALVNNLTPEIEQNTQSQYAQETIQAAKAYYPQANTSDEQDTPGYSSANTDWQDLNQDLNYSVADGNEELWSHEQERRQDQPQDNQSDTKWSDFLSIQGIVSKLSSEHFDEDGARKSNQGVEIEGNVAKVSDGELVITANGSVIDTVQKISGFSLPSGILDKAAIEAVVDQYKDYKANADKLSDSWKYAPLLAGATIFNLFDSPLSIKANINNQGISKTTQAGIRERAGKVITNAEKGRLGEEAADLTMRRAGYEKLPSKVGSNNGFDGVYIKRGSNGEIEDIILDIIINESKFNKANLSKTVDGSKQMSEQWINNNILRMKRSVDPEVRQAGQLLDENRDLIRTKLNRLTPDGINKWESDPGGWGQ